MNPTSEPKPLTTSHPSRIPRLALLAVTLLGLAGPAGAATRPDPARLEARIDELFADVSRSDSPGAAVAVIQDGRVIYENAFGMADLERGVALSPRSVFEIGSVSKQFTAFCILLLETDGLLTLDDDVRAWIPELPEYGRPITLRHLLHHTSGIRDIETLLPLAGIPWVNDFSTDQSLDLITRQKGLNFLPGEEFLYSNSGYLLLARVVREVSGLSLREFARRRLFEPLGMKHTTFWDDPEQIVPDRALPYSPSDSGWRQALWNLPFAGPAGLYTTVEDLALWDANFYDNRLGGGAGLIEAMTSPGTLTDGEELHYAAGLFLGSHRGRATVEHGGAWMGYRSVVMRLPDERLTVIILSNASRITVGARTIADLVLAQEEAPAEPSSEPAPPGEAPAALELSAEQLAAWTGTYWNDRDRLLRTLEVRDGTLFYVRTNGASTALGASDERSFFMIGLDVRVSVVFTGSDVPGERTMTVAVEGEEPLVFQPVVEPAARALRGTAGAFWSAELGRELRLVLENGKVQARWSDEERTVAAEFIRADELLVPGFIEIPWNTQDVRLALERDPDGDVTRLSLDCDMVRGVSFERRAAELGG